MTRRRKKYGRTLKGYWLHRTLASYDWWLFWVFLILTSGLAWLLVNYQQYARFLLLIPTTLSALITLILVIRICWRHRRLNQYRTIYWLKQISGLEFEHYIANLLKRCGHKAKITRESGDFGVDIVSYKNNRKYVTQCKNINDDKKKVGSPEMQQFLGSMKIYSADSGIFVTTTGFTKDATTIAKQHKIHLIDGLLLARLVEQKFGRRSMSDTKNLGSSSHQR